MYNCGVLNAIGSGIEIARGTRFMSIIEPKWSPGRCSRLSLPRNARCLRQLRISEAQLAPMY